MTGIAWREVCCQAFFSPTRKLEPSESKFMFSYKTSSDLDLDRVDSNLELVLKTWDFRRTSRPPYFALSCQLKNLSCTNMRQLTCNAKQQVSRDNDEFPFWKSEHFNFLHCWVASAFHTGSYNAIQFFSQHQFNAQPSSTQGNAYNFWPKLNTGDCIAVGIEVQWSWWYSAVQWSWW